MPLFQWADHLRIAYFDSNDLPHWTLEHPRDDPALAVTLRLPSPDEPPDPPPVARPWTEQRSPKFHPAWVELETSLQWRFFRDTVALLRARKNRVFVLVGPFNEHMLTDAGREVYHQRLRDVEAWLQSEEIPYYVPPALPSELYADLSHPLAAGYARLARELSAQPAFADFQRLNGTP